MFLPATPAETPFHSWCSPHLGGAAAGTGMMPPGAECLSCTGGRKTDS